VEELLAKQLIKKDGRQLSIHRVVQEAVNVRPATVVRSISGLPTEFAASAGKTNGSCVNSFTMLMIFKKALTQHPD
jgi:hypothetical protein